MDLSVERFCELMKEYQKLKQQGKRLEYSKFQEWRRYLDLCGDDIYYQNIKQYLNILELFIQNDITVQEFIDQFTKLRIQDVQITADLHKKIKSESIRTPNLNSLGLTDIILDIDSLIILFDSSLDSTVEPKPSYRINEKQLKKYLQEDISLIRQYLEKS